MMAAHVAASRRLRFVIHAADNSHPQAAHAIPVSRRFIWSFVQSVTERSSIRRYRMSFRYPK